jgi:APA family basic amino acid/polyamine antiporter
LLQLNAITAPWMPAFVTLCVAALACLGSILALLAGVSRTAATMAEDQELPKIFAGRNRFGAPWFSETLIAAGAILLVQLGELVWVIGFSSFSVLLYYAIGHLSAMRMSKAQPFWSRLVGITGFLLCVLLAVVVPGPAVIVSGAIILVALIIRRLVQSRRVV